MKLHDTLLETGTNEFEIIEFFIDEQTPQGPRRLHFGVNVVKVIEVVEAMKGLAPSPSAPHPSFLGAVPLRDLVLPVIDLSVWLRVDRVPAPHELIIVTEIHRQINGFLVSGVVQIHRMGWGDVQPPGSVLGGLPENCVTGMVRIEDRFVLLVDLEQLLSELSPDTHEIHAEPEPDIKDQPASVLIVDDSYAVRFMLNNLFTEAGFTADVATNGAEAWERLSQLKAECEAQGVPPHTRLNAVVADVEMPQMDGYTLTRHIKEDPALKIIPVVLFSSVITDNIRHKGEAVGADDQINKPEFNSLAARVTELIKERRSRA